MAVLTVSAGKHYPGEQLPRWALHCHWRADGQPIWTDAGLLASDDDSDTATARDGRWDVQLLQHSSGRTITKSSGNVAYYCRIHPNMKGEVTVAPNEPT